MTDSPASKPQGVFRFRLLPSEVRCRIYYFAVVEPHPLPLIPHRIHTHNGFFDAYAVEKDMRMLNTSPESRREMDAVLYSENTFSFSVRPKEVEQGTRLFQVDLKRIQKCYIFVNDMTGWPKDKNGGSEHVRDLTFWNRFVGTLVFESYQMKYLLVECEPQPYRSLAHGLSPLSMLRKIRLAHFRSRESKLHHYFRFLEILMTGDRPMPFADYAKFWEEPTRAADLLERPEESWLIRGLDATVTVLDKSEEQMEATAKELYSILGMEGGFVPQSKLDKTFVTVFTPLHSPDHAVVGRGWL